MDDALAPLDRRTLAFWRTSNIVGWAASALAVAYAMHWIAAEYSGRYFAQAALDHKWEWTTGWFVLPSFAFRAAVSVMIGIAVGLIVGGRAWRRQAVVAASAATAYALIAIYLLSIHPGATETYRAGPQQILVTGPRLAHGFGGHGASGWIYDGLTLLTVPVAAAVARISARRRNA